jgi:hypothetical protein
MFEHEYNYLLDKILIKNIWICEEHDKMTYQLLP